MSSLKECEIAIKSIMPLKKKFLIGYNIRKMENYLQEKNLFQLLKN